MNVSDFKKLPMELSHEEIASLILTLTRLRPDPVEGVRLLSGLHDRQQLLWRPLDAVSLKRIDEWLSMVWLDDFDFIDAAATLVVSLDLPASLACLRETAESSSGEAVARLAREALEEL